MESAGVVGRFERSPSSRMNPSIALNVRRNELEIDLIVWESGEAELAMLELDGSISQQHFEDIQNQEKLSEILGRLVALALLKPLDVK